jgi:tetratricopeptide (TPR) repeat protein
LHPTQYSGSASDLDCRPAHRSGSQFRQGRNGKSSPVIPQQREAALGKESVGKPNMTEPHQSSLLQSLNRKHSNFRVTTLFAAISLVAPLSVISAFGQTTPTAQGASGGVEVAPIPAAKPSTPPTRDRATAYYHAALADTYEDMATNYGRQEYVTRAVEEYKLAINADPNSNELAIGLAELYFRAGRIREAVQTTQELIKRDDNNLEAHKLLGRIYLRSLGQSQDQGLGSAPSPSNQVLDQAIAEFVKIVALEPKSLENHLLLGQLYTVKHDTAKAEAQFKAAQSIEPASEDVVLNLARLYAEGGDVKRSADLLEAVPVNDRTPKEEFALGAAYEQTKEPKKAIAAYQRSVDMEPENLDASRALAQALLADNQLDEALKQFKQLAESDTEDASSLVRISEIQRRQGKYTEALATIRKARVKEPDSLEAGYNEGLLLDVLGRYDESVAVYLKMVDLTGHANGAYTPEEKSNRSVFLERLAAVYHEENKTSDAIATYQKMIELGGDIAKRGYQGEVDTYRDAKMFDEATAICRKAVAANPDDRDLKLLLAWQLADTGKLDEGLSLANSLLSGKPSDREVYLQISQIQLRLKHYKEAEDALAKAEPFATKDEDKANLYLQKGALAELEKHYDQAEQYFHKVLEIDPNNATTLNNLGYMLVDKTSRYTDALKYIRKAVELEPTNGAFLDSLGWVYFKLGQFEPAEDNLRKAVERTSTDPTVHDHLGDLYEKTGRIRLAAAQWEISIAEFAKSASADVEPAEVAKVQKKLEGARVKLAKQESNLGVEKQP